ncbi:MAG: glycerophosphodiester phosphodiesterase [Nitrospirae bacterium]|nr:glycerophosphodiester phosphodiesterase [Nitrospirota bacterium]
MFLKTGHRGARAYEVENTIGSFKKAVELGANAIELDVRQSKDRELIVCHDDNLKRVFGIDLLINEATLKQLRQATGDRIPSLKEALGYIGKKVEKILVELKETGQEKRVLDEVNRAKLKDRVIIVSFHEEALAAVRKLDRELETGLIYTKFRNPIETAMKLQAQYLVPLYRFVHTKDIEKAHKNDLKVIVWTINTTEEAEAYIAKGVDGIATDRPDIFQEIA